MFSGRYSYPAIGLNLVVAAIVLWNRVYLERAIEALREAGTFQHGKNHLGDRNEFLPTVHGFNVSRNFQLLESMHSLSSF